VWYLESEKKSELECVSVCVCVESEVYFKRSLEYLLWQEWKSNRLNHAIRLNLMYITWANRICRMELK